MKSSTRCFLLCAAPVIVLMLAGCASSGASSASARPVLYPNATLNRVGDAQGRMEVSACMARAQASGLSPSQNTNEVGRRAGEGAAVAGVASAVGALITGRGSEGMLRAGAAGAAVGGSAGAVSGAFHNDRPNSVYRNFVQRCLSEKGFEVIGWN
jgi:outer membrane lipoprotein SlyB